MHREETAEPYANLTGDSKPEAGFVRDWQKMATSTDLFYN
jgi:CRISPR/Cas system-associated protein Csm6